MIRAMFTFADSCAARGEDVRGLTLPDLFPLHYPKSYRIGPCEFTPLYVVRHAGKTVAKSERIQHQAVARAKDPVVCPIGSLALHFFAKENMGRKMPSPDVTQGKEAW